MSGEIAMSGIEPRSSRRIWILAGIAALALHLGGAALTFWHLPTDGTNTDTLGAAAVEVGIEMASPDEEQSDLPLGAGTDAAMAAQENVDQKAEVKQAELPKDVPVPTDDPDRTVTPSDQKTPEQEQSQAATEASQQSVAVAATAKQTLDDSLLKADVATAPNIGLGKDTQKLKAKWESKIVGYIQSHLRYPSVRKDKTTTVKVRFVLDRLGHVLSVVVLQSSGDSVFDDAALATIRRSDPLPRPPVALTDEQFSYDLPMAFAERK